MGMKERSYPRHSKSITRGLRWKTIRMAVLERDGFRCRACGARGRLEVDHVQPVRDAPGRAWEPANLQALCPPCHTKKTRIECGHPPPSEDRQDWRQAVAALERPAKRSIMEKDVNDA